MRNIGWAVSIVSVSLLAAPALAIDITGPGQTVPDGMIGVVQGDLTCGPADSGITLQDRSTLRLNGHTLEGCGVGGSGFATERVRLKVLGPGEIRNAGIAFGAGALRVEDVTISDPPAWGVHGANGVNGGPSSVLVTKTGSTFTTIAKTADPLPAPLTGTFNSFSDPAISVSSPPDINNSGDIRRASVPSLEQ